MRGPDGAVVSVTGLSVDISERHTSEDAMRQSETRYRLATQATSDVIWDWDFTAAPSTGARTCPASSATRRGAATGLDWWTERLHPEDRERVERDLQAAIDGTTSYWQDEYRLLRQDGTWADVEDRGSVGAVDVRGRAVRMVGAIHDVSERKAAEAEAQRRAEFEQHLIGIVSHDLRNPIAAIITSADTLLKRYGLDERSRGAPSAASSPAPSAATACCRDMLDFTQARLGGGIPVVREPLDLHAFVRTWCWTRYSSRGRSAGWSACMVATPGASGTRTGWRKSSPTW